MMIIYNIVILRVKVFLLIITIITFGFTQYEYSLEDVNPNSSTFGTNVWYPEFSDYITLHYFGTQG